MAVGVYLFFLKGYICESLYLPDVGVLHKGGIGVYFFWSEMGRIFGGCSDIALTRWKWVCISSFSEMVRVLAGCFRFARKRLQLVYISLFLKWGARICQVLVFYTKNVVVGVLFICWNGAYICWVIPYSIN